MGTLVVKGLTIVNNCKSLTLNETCANIQVSCVMVV